MDPAIKKQVLRSFSYGLYIVTVADGEDVNAFTANWLIQCSFEPPMLALAIENDARSLGMIERAGTFAVNVVAEDGRELASRMGRSSQRDPHKLAKAKYDRGSETGSPLLQESVGWVECRLVSQTPSGDHTLVVGGVVEAGIAREVRPLTLAEAGFRYSG